MGGFRFDGLLGVAIFLATIIALLISIFFASLVYLLGKKGLVKTGKQPLSKYFIFSAILLLVFDGLFYLFYFGAGNKTISPDEGKILDELMLYVWIPVHIAVYFALAFLMRFIKLRKK